MSLNIEDRMAMIAYRHEKADIALEDATFLTDAGKYGLAANRLYYALYHAASALLLSKEIITKRHSSFHFLYDKEYLARPDARKFQNTLTP